MSIDCPWSIYSTILALTFYIPFKTKHSLLSAGNRSATILILIFSIWHFNMISLKGGRSSGKTLTDLKTLFWHHRKYIQVCVQNVSDVNFKLADMKLSEKQHASLELRSLNIKKQQVTALNACLTVTVGKLLHLWTNVCLLPSCVQLLCSKHSVFCLWEVRWKDNLPSCLQCVFSTDFSPLNQDVSVFKLFHHQFQLERVTVGPFKSSFTLSPKDYWSCNVSLWCCQTLYSVRAEILPPAGEQHCRCGLLCKLEMFITRLSEPAEGEMAEESKTDLDGLKTTKLMYQGRHMEG